MNNKNNYSHTRYLSASRDRFSYYKNTNPHNLHGHDTTIIKEIKDLIDRHTDPHKDCLIDVTLVPDIDHVHTQETTILQDKYLLQTTFKTRRL